MNARAPSAAIPAPGAPLAPAWRRRVRSLLRYAQQLDVIMLVEFIATAFSYQARGIVRLTTEIDLALEFSATATLQFMGAARRAKLPTGAAT